MKKRRVAIADDDGRHIAASYLPADSVDHEDGNFEGLCAPGITNLRGCSFARSSLYWALLADADLTGCNFEGADLRGVTLTNARLVDANFRNADLGLNNLNGASRLQGADFTGAILDGCNLSGAQYDSRTRFPAGFDPRAAGMVYFDRSS